MLVENLYSIGKNQVLLDMQESDYTEESFLSIRGCVWKKNIQKNTADFLENFPHEIDVLEMCYP